MENMTNIYKSKYFFSLLWMLATSIGMSLGFGFARIIHDNFGHPYEPELIFLETFALASLFTGLAQWFILRYRSRRSWIWIPSTIMGVLVGLLISLLVYEFVFQDNGWFGAFIMFAVTGISAGALQWISLHRKLTGSSKWILASAVGWGCGGSITFELFADYLWGMFSRLPADLIFGFILGLIVGFVSGMFVKSTILSDLHKNAF
jgi:hypothetical protein